VTSEVSVIFDENAQSLLCASSSQSFQILAAFYTFLSLYPRWEVAHGNDFTGK
jgi:hypothetical protein